jgi:hypothetical protein
VGAQGQCYKLDSTFDVIKLSHLFPDFKLTRLQPHQYSVRDKLKTILYSDKSLRDTIMILKYEEYAIASISIKNTTTNVDYSLFYPGDKSPSISEPTNFTINPSLIQSIRINGRTYIAISGTAQGCTGSFCRIQYTLVYVFNSKNQLLYEKYYTSGFVHKSFEEYVLFDKNQTPYLFDIEYDWDSSGSISLIPLAPSGIERTWRFSTRGNVFESWEICFPN